MKKKKKCEISGTVLTVDMLAANILVIVCENREVLKGNLREIYKKVNAEEDYIRDERMLDEILEEECHCGAMTITLEGIHRFDTVVIFFAKNLADVSYETMVHELYHVTQTVCRNRGIEDDETEAYLIEHLFGSLLDAVDEYKDNK